MAWYDVFSRFYDAALERLYRPHRESLAARIPQGTRLDVLDLACGTGANFPPLLERLAPGSRVLGVDLSERMLERARRRVERAGWRGVALVACDAARLDAAAITPALGGAARVDVVLCALGLSVIPDWEQALRATFALLRPGGRYLILDVHAERRVPQSAMVELFARADLSRRPWTLLERIGEDTSVEDLRGSPHVFGGRLFVASARKPAIGELETPRARGRRPRASDLDELAALWGDPRVGATLGGARTREQAAATLARFEAHWDARGFGPWLVHARDSGEFAGYCGLLDTQVGGAPAVELLYALRPELQGKGLASELAAAVARCADGELGLRELVGYTLPTNAASRRVLERAGFRYERDVVHAGLPHVFYRRSRSSTSSA
jgi:RimJ/RimL family protein N-acetyltransferase/ubiquinone/menaquinone biosynthesis C-methylase UbiE